VDCFGFRLAMTVRPKNRQDFSMFQALKDRIERSKAELDRLRPLSTVALAQLQKHYDVELTYTSNAIEGNTLTLRETAEVIEHGITVGGKSLRDHLEAVDHFQALQWMRQIAATAAPLGEDTVRELHRRIVARSQSEIAGLYSELPRRIAGSPVISPNPAKIPQLMQEFGGWLTAAPLDPETAFVAHFRLTAIHPFGDGNGRTARLLMNLLLIRGGYPPVAVRPEDRKAYLDALERGSLAEDLAPFQLLMHERLDTTLAGYVNAVREAVPPQ
jgi:Fic family protein